ncbi:MAG: hypothetical protein JMDDDDMK_03050 [Acidobacteria bacterium]|nr:hypothetical protein [Acidobacteriota bacterium]
MPESSCNRDIDGASEPAREILAMALGRVANQYRKGVRRRTKAPWETRFERRMARHREQPDRDREWACGTGMLEAAWSRLYRRQVRLLLFLLSREGVYVVNSIGQVFGFRETGRQFGDILRTLNWSCDEELRDISPASFDELNLDDPLIREHFSKRANSFAAAAAEEGLSFFFIGAESDKMNSVWRQG